jgi:hypothetical protein
MTPSFTSVNLCNIPNPYNMIPKHPSGTLLAA